MDLCFVDPETLGDIFGSEVKEAFLKNEAAKMSDLVKNANKETGHASNSDCVPCSGSFEPDAGEIQSERKEKKGGVERPEPEAPELPETVVVNGTKIRKRKIDKPLKIADFVKPIAKKPKKEHVKPNKTPERKTKIGHLVVKKTICLYDNGEGNVDEWNISFKPEIADAKLSVCHEGVEVEDLQDGKIRITIDK